VCVCGERGTDATIGLHGVGGEEWECKKNNSGSGRKKCNHSQCSWHATVAIVEEVGGGARWKGFTERLVPSVFCYFGPRCSFRVCLMIISIKEVSKR